MVLASWAYGLERGTHPVLRRESGLNIRSKQICLNLEGAIRCTETSDEVKDLSFRERHVL